MARDRSHPQYAAKASRKLSPKKTLHIFCEGQFEHRYFEYLRSSLRLPGDLLKISVTSLGSQGDARKMLEQARKEIRQGGVDPQDSILCLVFDFYS